MTRRFDREAALVFFVALGLRLWTALESRSSLLLRLPVGDGRAYDAWARSIAGGDWLGSGVFYQAPLYPYFLGAIYATVGSSPLVVGIVQAVVASVGVLCLLAAGRVFLGTRAAFLGALLLAVYPPAVFYDSLLQKTVLDVALSCLFLFAAARCEASSPSGTEPKRGLVFALGAALGLLSLSRENALGLLALIVPWLAGRYRGPAAQRLARTLLFGTGLAAVLLPVGIRNLTRGGEFALTTAQFGPNFYLGNNPSTDGRYVPLREGRGDARFEREDATEIAAEETGRTLTPAEVSRFWFDKSAAWIRAHPGDWLRLLGQKALLSLNALETSDTESIEAHRDAASFLRWTSPLFHFGLLAPLAALGLWLARREVGRAWPAHAVILVIFAGLVAFFVFGRYRAPAVPALCLFAGVAVSSIASRRRVAVSRGDWIVGLLVAALLAVVANLSRSEGKAQHALNYYSVGSALLEAGRNPEASAALEQALTLRPDYAAAVKKLAIVRFREARFDDAEAMFRRAIELRPNDADARTDFGLLLFEQRRYPAALEQFQQGFRLRNDDVDLACNLGATFLALERFTEALAPLERALELEPDHALAQANLGTALFRLGRFAEADRHLARAAEQTPGSAPTQIMAARAREALGDPVGAREYFHRALAVDPKNADARAALDRMGDAP